MELYYYIVGLASTSPAFILYYQDPSYIISSYLGFLFWYINPSIHYYSLSAGINIIIDIISLHTFYLPYLFLYLLVFLIFQVLASSATYFLFAVFSYYQSGVAGLSSQPTPSLLHQTNKPTKARSLRPFPPSRRS